MSKPKNPSLQRFFSRSNYEFLYSSIIDAISETHGYKIKEGEFKPMLKRTMQYVVESTPTDEQSLEYLNKETSNITARDIIKYIQKETVKFQQQESRNRQVQDARMQYQQSVNPNIPQMRVTPSPRPSVANPQNPHLSREHDDVYNQLVSERNYNRDDEIPIPNFQEPEPEYADDVDQLYQQAEQSRQHSDIMGPPNKKDVEMFQNNGQQVRTKPIQYEPRPSRIRTNQHRNNTKESNRDENHMRMSTKVSDIKSRQKKNNHNNNDMVTPPYEEPFTNEDDFKFDESQWEEPSDFDITEEKDKTIEKGSIEIEQPPTAAISNSHVDRVARLIPYTSRNLTTDSDAIPHIYIVDSRDRDQSIYPTPSEYRLSTAEYRDVVSISLEGAEIPITDYIINAYNNLIYFQEEMDITQIATIPFGNYTVDELAMEIENVMNATSANSITYTVTSDPITSKYTISSSASFPYIFNLVFFGGLESCPSINEINCKNEPVYIENSVGPVIGFDKKNLTGSLSYTGQFVYNLAGEKYIVMFINEQADVIEANKSSVHKAFAKITINVPQGSVNFYNNVDNRYIKYFSPPIKLSNLSVRFQTYNGNLYNFNGQEHSFTLKIVCKDITKPPYYQPLGVQ